jgi:bifunctional DNA-binding transcriptional regulator/antitoxin component of YhaV-PrlF toxin-antitoxin module
MTDEHPVAPLILPDTVAPLSHQSLPLPALPTIAGDTGLVLGVAGVSHSGRVGDQVLLDALGWAPGDRLHLDVLDSTLLLRRHPEGTQVINTRGQVFLPAGTRALLRIADNDRVVLVAAPRQGLLMLHPRAVVGALLAGFYDALPGGPHVT